MSAGRPVIWLAAMMMAGTGSVAAEAPASLAPLMEQKQIVASELARQVAVQERAREVRRRFMGTGTPYTPTTVNFYGNP